MVLAEARRLAVVIFGSFLIAVSLNFFLINANVYASGFTGAAQLLFSIFNDFIGFHVSTGLLLFLLNIPVLILGWLKVGRSFTIYSIISVVAASLFLQFLPVLSISDDILLNAVFGGVISGFGVGISLKIGTSTGGMDIVAMVLSRMHDKPIGIYMFILNGIIVATAGLLYNLENALYTIVALYATTIVIDRLHTRHQKLTVMIITEKSQDIQEAIYERMIRGITVVPAKGAYSGDERTMLYLVITRYELYDLEKIIASHDEQAFTNVVETVDVFGHFRTEVM
ncbi:MAG TPA: YitT family protein [Bacillota bacterium]|nr:YitT family protein [Bacillota bacterium]